MNLDAEVIRRARLWAKVRKDLVAEGVDPWMMRFDWKRALVFQWRA